MGTRLTRQAKMDWFRRRFAVALQKDRVLDLKLTIAMFQLECASSKQTAMELLEMFDRVGTIKLGLDGIVVLK